jgi:hypothetical protein
MALVLIAADQPASRVPMDSANPTCPASPNVSNYSEMYFTVQEIDGRSVLLAEGVIDDNLIPRLLAALGRFRGDEIWLRYPGGNARVGNEAGYIIRQRGLNSRIPSGWTYYGACNFMFMGGVGRIVDANGYFMVGTNPPFEVTGVPAEQREARADEIARASALMATEDMDFVLRMGIPRALLTAVMYARSRDVSRRHCLTQEELRRYNLVNG